jgi:hypothetical protein
MRFHTFLSALPVTAIALFLAAACSSEPEAQDPSVYPQPYPQPYGQQTAYPQPTTTATTAGFGIPCQSDAGCGTHRCNLTTQTCAFPCGGPQDCATGATCSLGVCLPGATQ